MKFVLDPSGYFYYRGTIVSRTKLPKKVKRLLIYYSINPIRLMEYKGSIYNFNDGEYLEVVTCNLERVFFQLREGVFVRCYFPPAEILEGEDELSKLLNLRYEN